MKTVIIEDEYTAAKHLKHVLDEVGGFSILVVLESIRSAIEWFKHNRIPDIVFMDIHLADGSAFEIFEHISITCPIIFTTAYDEYALKAFKVNSIAYLLKPIEPNEVKEAVKKLNELFSTGLMHESVENLISLFKKNDHYRTHFLVSSGGDKLVPVLACDIAFFYLDSSILKAYTYKGASFRFDYTLTELESLINPNDFFRANRQFIIARDSIKDIDIWFTNRLSVNLTVSVPEKILISKARITEFKKWYSG